jgi:ABC-2 type transport system ATP-binding protein
MIIEAQNIAKRYGRLDALSGLSLSVAEGSAYALVGANGAGKTTSIKMIMNILAPSEGEISVLGVNSRQLGPEQFRQIGYVSESQKLPAHMTVADYLSYLRPFYPSWDNGLEVSLREQFQLPGDRKIRALSHGMCIKLVLVAALAFRPRLLVLDEPLSGLDPLVRDEVIEGLLAQADAMTIFISSHELAEIEGLVSNVGFLDKGRMLFQEPVEHLKERVRAVRVTLKSDATVPAKYPQNWVEIRAIGNVISFVDTAYDEALTATDIAAVFGPAKFVQTEMMDFRSIFTVFARANQATGERL